MSGRSGRRACRECTFLPVMSRAAAPPRNETSASDPSGTRSAHAQLSQGGGVGVGDGEDVVEGDECASDALGTLLSILHQLMLFYRAAAPQSKYTDCHCPLPSADTDAHQASSACTSSRLCRATPCSPPQLRCADFRLLLQGHFNGRIRPAPV